MEDLSTSMAWKRLMGKGKGQAGEQKKKREKKKTKIRRGRKENLVNYQQRSLRGANLDKTDVEEFGDKMGRKGMNMFRIGLHNISNLSEDGRVSKSRQLVDYIVHKHFDVFLMTEVGLCWKKIPPLDQWFERIRGKFRTVKYKFANNENELDNTSRLQWGGSWSDGNG